MELGKLSATELSENIKAGKISVTEAAEYSLGIIKKIESETGAYITVDEKGALERAAEVQKGIDDGKYAGPLAGVPIAVKDNICTKGVPTTAASKILEGFIPQFSATAYEKAAAQGMVMLGKTNMDEFAMGSTTETSYFKVTKNPRNTAHVPGGSSGGSAAAVAAGEAPIALGSDTGGSIRQPCAYCGVTGIKPTYGTVSRYGLLAYGSSLDQIGPIAKNIVDAVALLDVIAGHDEKDSTSVRPGERKALLAGMKQSAGDAAGSVSDFLSEPEYNFSKYLIDDVKGLKIGIPKDYFGDGLEAEVSEAVLSAAKVLEKKGAEIEEFNLGLVDYAIPAYYVIADAEASSNLSRYDGVRYGYRAKDFEGVHEMYKKSRSEGFGAEVRRRIMLGAFVLSSGYYDAYYLKALRVKALIKKAFNEAFSKYDIILGPVAPSCAPLLGESLSDPMKMYLSDVYTISCNLAGLPGISLPCAVGAENLPIGMQLISDCFREDLAIRAAYSFQKEFLLETCFAGGCAETGEGGLGNLHGKGE